MAYVLPDARDLQPALTSELERKAYRQLTESNFKVLAWTAVMILCFSRARVR